MRYLTATCLLLLAATSASYAQTDPLADLSDKAKLCEQFARAQLAKAGASGAETGINSKYDSASGFCTVRMAHEGSDGEVAGYLRTNQFDPSSTRIQNKMKTDVNAVWGESEVRPKEIICKDTKTLPDGTVICAPGKTMNKDSLTPYFQLDGGF